MEINEIDDFQNSVNEESFSNDESSNEFNTTMQVNNNISLPSVLPHAQINSGVSPIHKTRSGFKYISSKSSKENLKRLNNSSSSSIQDGISASPSKILSNENVSAIVCDQWMPSMSQDREETSQDVEDDEDDAMEYDEEYQTENQDSAVSSPQTSTNKYKAPTSTKKLCEESVEIDENSLISSTLTYDLHSKLLQDDENDISESFKNSFIESKSCEITSSTPSTSKTNGSKFMTTRQMRNRIKTQTIKISKRNYKPKAHINDSKTAKNLKIEESVFLMPRYPLRSRARLEKVKVRLQESVVGKKTLNMIPVEIYYKIFQYLPIQDLFRIQRVNKRFKEAVDNHLFMVKRINFSCGLPFAFLPDCLNDAVLKRILSKTPEVTHILGFYPRKIDDISGHSSSLTYNGIMIALKQCSKLRSVEIMDLELMSRIVHTLNRVKFHGMFRNRPNSWDEEYVNPFLRKINSSNTSMPGIDNNSSGMYCQQSLSPMKYAQYSKLTALKSLFSLPSLKQSTNIFTNFVTYSWMSYLVKMTYTPIGSGLPLLQPINQAPVVNFVSPLPSLQDKLTIPNTINNLTKLDLVSVCIQHLPRLENIKYLHLKWVRFTSPDPFQNFQSPKIQSFVMNNCIGPIRGIRYVRMFSALARAPQLNRLELVSTRIVEGLFENFLHESEQAPRCFRSLQRLVLASNKDFAELDIAALMLSSHQSLNHLALSVTHARNSLMLSLANAGVVMQKLESVILGYQDPFQSMLTSVEISNMFLHDSPDHSMPISRITDRGIAALMKISPKLISLHLRHAVYVEDPSLWLPKKWFHPIGNRQFSRSNTNDTADDQMPNSFALKSLTLENCPGIKPESISFILNHPSTSFPHLEMLVLRDMFMPLPRCNVPNQQHAIDHDAIFSPSTLSGINPLVLSCRHRNYNTDSKQRIDMRFHILDTLSNRFLPHYYIVKPGHDASYVQHSTTISSNDPNQDIQTPVHQQQRLPRIFIPNIGLTVTSTAATAGAAANLDLPLAGLTNHNFHHHHHHLFHQSHQNATVTPTSTFGMSSNGLPLYCAAGPQPLFAQHINIGAAIRSSDFIRHHLITGAMSAVSRLHQLETMGLANLATVPALNYIHDDRIMDASDDINFSQEPQSVIVQPASVSKSSGSLKRKRTKSSDKVIVPSIISNLGLLFHKSILPREKLSKMLSKLQHKNDGAKTISKRRKLITELAGDPSFMENEFSNGPSSSKNNVTNSSNKQTDEYGVLLYEFCSVGTQTCVCGYIDWLDSTWQRDLFPNELGVDTFSSNNGGNGSGMNSTGNPSNGTSNGNPEELICYNCRVAASAAVSATNTNGGNTIVGGSGVAFSTASSSGSGMTSSSSTRTTYKHRMSNRSSGRRSTSFINIQDFECKLCSFPLNNYNELSTIGMDQPEPHLDHEHREWEAQDACVDTTSLKLYIRPQLYKLELKQNSFAHLTTLHMEKVGITHLVLTSCHRLKSITLENCPELQAIVINTGTTPPSDSMPGLRRIRIMRCPRFAIYNLLYHVTRFYPQHDDNLYITFRPFGTYNPLVEKALWLNSDSQHVMVSHVYRQDSSERNLEELCSSFDQLFREMLNFSESLIRRDILTVSDFAQVNNFTNGSFLRSEHGLDWDLMTDIPWISEVCCSMLPSDLGRTQHAADQLYELLSEIQSHLGNMKLRRRGIHLHVQLRDVLVSSESSETPLESSSLLQHILSPGSHTMNPLLPQSYTDDYLYNTHPVSDVNADYCEPSLSVYYPQYHPGSSPDSFDKFILTNPIFPSEEVSILPSFLRSMLDDDQSKTPYTFGPDINEKIPIPHNLSSEKVFRQQTTAVNVSGSTRTLLDTTSTNQPTSYSTYSDNHTQSSNSEFVSTKLQKFRSTLNALKKSSTNQTPSSPEVIELNHSTRSKTAELISNLGRGVEQQTNNCYTSIGSTNKNSNK